MARSNAACASWRRPRDVEEVAEPVPRLLVRRREPQQVAQVVDRRLRLPAHLEQLRAVEARIDEARVDRDGAAEMIERVDGAAHLSEHRAEVVLGRCRFRSQPAQRAERHDRRRQVAHPVRGKAQALDGGGVVGLALQVLAQLGRRFGHATVAEVLIDSGEQVLRHSGDWVVHHNRPYYVHRSQPSFPVAVIPTTVIPANPATVIPANPATVIPAKAGIQQWPYDVPLPPSFPRRRESTAATSSRHSWIPAFAGMTGARVRRYDRCARSPV